MTEIYSENTRNTVAWYANVSNNFKKDYEKDTESNIF